MAVQKSRRALNWFQINKTYNHRCDDPTCAALPHSIKAINLFLSFFFFTSPNITLFYAIEWTWKRLNNDHFFLLKSNFKLQW